MKRERRARGSAVAGGARETRAPPARHRAKAPREMAAFRARRCKAARGAPPVIRRREIAEKDGLPSRRGRLDIRSRQNTGFAPVGLRDEMPEQDARCPARRSSCVRQDSPPERRAQWSFILMTEPNISFAGRLS
ncbi:DUF2760 domain-containing protein, partial [Burkholderia pseudomallei]